MPCASLSVVAALFIDCSCITLIRKQYTCNFSIQFLQLATRLLRWTAVIFTQNCYTGLPYKKENGRRGRGVDRVHPLRLPFLVNALLTGKQVVMPFATIYYTQCNLFIIIRDENTSIKSVNILNAIWGWFPSLLVGPSGRRCHGAARHVQTFARSDQLKGTRARLPRIEDVDRRVAAIGRSAQINRKVPSGGSQVRII